MLGQQQLCFGSNYPQGCQEVAQRKIRNCTDVEHNYQWSLVEFCQIYFNRKTMLRDYEAARNCGQPKNYEKLAKVLKFIYSEKGTKFCKISTVDLIITTQDKSTVEILQRFVAFSEYMNFTGATLIFCIHNVTIQHMQSP